MRPEEDTGSSRKEEHEEEIYTGGAGCSGFGLKGEIESGVEDLEGGVFGSESVNIWVLVFGAAGGFVGRMIAFGSGFAVGIGIWIGGS